jgi:hypothetical protein
MIIESASSISSPCLTKRQLTFSNVDFFDELFMADNNSYDDSFSLHDLRVEAVCPPNEAVYCGAKDGDHFILKGEMMYLPPGQGFSIYSLGSLTNLSC